MLENEIESKDKEIDELNNKKNSMNQEKKKILNDKAVVEWELKQKNQDYMNLI